MQTGDAHIIRNAGGVVTDDAIRCLIISHHLLNTNEIILIHHTRCGMLAFTDDLLKAGLEGDPASEKLPGQATSRAFTSCRKCASTPSQFHAFRGQIEALDAARSEKQMERLAWDVRRGMSSIMNHPWIPTSGPDAMTVRGFVYDVDTGKLDEMSYPGPMGSFGLAAAAGADSGQTPCHRHHDLAGSHQPGEWAWLSSSWSIANISFSRKW